MVRSNLAVQTFFMISGFYMALVLNEKYRPDQTLVFLKQRFLRLAPAYWLVLLMTGVVGSGFFKSEMTGAILNTASWLALSILNIVVWGMESTLYLGIHASNGDLFFTGNIADISHPAYPYLLVPQAWSISLEISFYLLAPYLVRRSLRLQSAVMAASIALRYLLFLGFELPKDPWLYRFFPSSLCFFMAGSIAYQFYRRYKSHFPRYSKPVAWARWILYGIVIAYSRLPGHHEQRIYVFIPLVALLLPVLFWYTKDRTIDRFLGELSYPVYLVHLVGLARVNGFVEAHVTAKLQGLVYAAWVVFLAFLIYYFFERKIDQWRHSLLKGRKETPPAR